MEALMTTGAVLFAVVALIGVGAAAGFVAARLGRSAPAPAPVPVRPVAAAPPAPTPGIVQFQAEKSLPMPILVDYDPDSENEDDIPTTLYRHDDDDVEALLAEFDTGHERR